MRRAIVMYRKLNTALGVTLGSTATSPCRQNSTLSVKKTSGSFSPGTLLHCQRREFSTRTAVARGMQQLKDAMPTSTPRKPRGVHKGGDLPGFNMQRTVSPAEEFSYRFVKQWELECQGEWDALETFRGLPAPKKLFGNEAAEIVWPYAVLLENVIKIHPFTKSIYCYYPQRPLTEAGTSAIQLAVKFARECMIPITFHNTQCYVETEMLLEHGDVPWIVITCLDGRSETMPITQSFFESEGGKEGNAVAGPDAAKEKLLRTVLHEAESLCSSTPSPKNLWSVFHERPNQHNYLRIDYQWMGQSPEDRMAHTIHWSESGYKDPGQRHRARQLGDFLNYDNGMPLDPSCLSNIHREGSRATYGSSFGIQKFFSNSKAHSNESKWNLNR